MKHTIIRSFTTLIGAGLLVYVGWLFFQGYQVVPMDSKPWNMLILAVCMVLALFLLAVVFMPTLVPNNRWSLLLIGVVTILISHAYLEDSPSQMIYLADILKLIGAYLVIVGPMKLLISPQVEAARVEKDVEIIEV